MSNDFEIDPELTAACEAAEKKIDEDCLAGVAASVGDGQDKLTIAAGLLGAEVSASIRILHCLQINTTLQRRTLVALEDIHKQLEEGL